MRVRDLAEIGRLPVVQQRRAESVTRMRKLRICKGERKGKKHKVGYKGWCCSGGMAYWRRFISIRGNGRMIRYSQLQREAMEFKR